MARIVRFCASRVCALLVATVTLVTAGCEAPPIDWIDEAPARAAGALPLSGPPDGPLDSALADTSALAVRQLAADRQREAQALTFLGALIRDQPEASDTALSTAAVATAAGPAAAPPAMDGMDHRGHGLVAPAGPVAGPLGDGDTPRDPARCARTLRTAVAPGFGTAAVWWTRVANGRVHLVAAWRDGEDSAATRAWRGPLPVDTLDQGPEDAQATERGAHGCARPAPSVVWDRRTRFLHVAYAVRGPEGAGVFYAHQMDPRAAFEVPAAVLYGERLGVVRVASDGDVVAVAYEDPNTRDRVRVGLALSRTAGHTFEPSRWIASADAGEARDPHVAVQGRAVALGWTDVALPSTSAATAAPGFVTRRLRVRR